MLVSKSKLVSSLLISVFSHGVLASDNTGLNGTGIYNSSITPSSLPWNTYNYCNAPHVNAEHYVEPEVKGAKLVNVNVMIRHHKRTPDNLYPLESLVNPSSGWDCTNFLQMVYGKGATPVFHETDVPSWHPFLPTFWNGTCDEGQLTAEGLADSIKHGSDFWSVYHDKLGFLDTVNKNDIHIRTSSSTRTMQVASGLLFGMDPNTISQTWKVITQPSSIDSIVPSYSCPAADAIRDAYQAVPAWTDHLQENEDLQNRLDTLLGTTGLSAWSSWYDHFFDTFTSRTCHGHSLPCNATTGGCVSGEDAARVHALGDFEYNYIWNSAENSTDYTRLTFGVMFQELVMNFNAIKNGAPSPKIRFYVGHDGSMVRLAKGLGFGKIAPLRWPALGSEIVMEVWEIPKDHMSFVRVLFEGTPVFGLDWIPLEDFIALLESNVPSGIYQLCNTSE